MAYFENIDKKKGGFSAGKKPGKPGTVGKLFPLEKKGQRGTLTKGSKKGK